MPQVWPPLPPSGGDTSEEVFNTTEEEGNRIALAVSYPQLLSVLGAIFDGLDKINRHLAQINDEEDPL